MLQIIYHQRVKNDAHNEGMSFKSIAILPFLNLSSDKENEYFSDGITEELINALTKVEGLKVTARTSSFAFKGRPMDIRHIGNELGVSTLLEGSVRKSKNRVRITTQLVRTDDGFQIWSAKFDRELVDIFELQDEISLLIAEQIRENFGHFEIADHLVDVATKDLDAYEYYLKGRFHQLKWEKAGFLEAIKNYEQAILKDEQYVQAYYGIFQCYGMMAAWELYPREEGNRLAYEAFQKGSAINNELPEYYFSLNYQALWSDWDYQSSFDFLKQALQLSPNNAEYLESAAELYMSQGAFDDAKRLIKKAIELNPLSANHHFTLGNIHYLDGDYEQALPHFERSLEIDPAWVLSLNTKAFCLIQLNRKEQLFTYLEANPHIIRAKDFIQLYQIRNEGKSFTNADFSNSDTGYFSWNVYIPTFLNKFDEAVEMLKYGVENRFGQHINFKNDPLLESLRSHQVFEELKNQYTVFLPSYTELFATKSRDAEAKMSDDEAANWVKKISAIMDDQKLYLDQNIDLKMLASEVGLHPNTLSWLLNDRIAMNFNDFINSYRLQCFQEKALQQDAKNYTLLGLAFESGFNSKSTFNDFFKKKTGLTPRAWLKQQ